MTNTEVETRTLAERVDEVIAKADARDAAETAARNEKAKTTLLSALKRHFDLDVAPESVAFESHESDWAVAQVEGFKFGVMADDEWDRGLALLRPCATCNGFAVRSAHSVEDLAAALRGTLGYPHGSGDCVKREAMPQTSEQRLTNALRDFIAEHNYQG